MNSPLVDYSIRGLQSCWMPDSQAFSHAFRPDRPEPNVSIPKSDVYYTLNTVLGLSRVSDKSALPWDLNDLFLTNCRRLPDLPVPIYAYGMALWAAAELQLDLPDQTLNVVTRLLGDRQAWMEWSAQDLGLMISGVVAQAGHTPNPWADHAHALIKHFHEHYSSAPSGLFFETPTRFRRRFATFATATYLTLACFHYGERFGDQKLIDRALKCVDALCDRQGSLGEWPWFWHVDSGRVLDPYQVYSVHQDGMAPAFLHHAERHGYGAAREAVSRGFEWIFGANELNQSMLLPEHGIILRSHKRAENWERQRRVVRAMANWATGRSAGLIGARGLTINRECRSYHLGWVLWSFAGRDDYPALTHHPALGGVAG